ncbi:MAG TPA: purine and other phosphorylase-like protein, family 1 [Candidatus Dormibacteraeota bacterium]|nr:purine and other phosphorylase-like protein, family 1 [Candidatus Dormibacteraeota bacterium]
MAALLAEARTLDPGIRYGDTVDSLADGTLLVVSGMGPAAAGQGARRLIEAGAGALMSWGMAGGLDPDLGTGTLLLPSEVVSPEGEVLRTASDWRERLCAALAAARPVCAGRLLTCREPLGTAADKASAFRRTGAAAVDMESFAVAEVAARGGLPFVALRVIVDAAADAVPRALLAVAAGTGAVQVWRLLGGLARAPADLAALSRLVRNYRVARRVLSIVARSGALAPPSIPRARRPGGS